MKDPLINHAITTLFIKSISTEVQRKCQASLRLQTGKITNKLVMKSVHPNLTLRQPLNHTFSLFDMLIWIEFSLREFIVDFPENSIDYGRFLVRFWRNWYPGVCLSWRQIRRSLQRIVLRTQSAHDKSSNPCDTAKLCGCLGQLQEMRKKCTLVPGSWRGPPLCTHGGFLFFPWSAYSSTGRLLRRKRSTKHRSTSWSHTCPVSHAPSCIRERSHIT